MQLWQRIDPTKKTKVGWRTVVTKNFILPDGEHATFETFNKEHTHSAGVIALTTDKRVIIARQFRAGPEIIMEEIPGGGVEKGEADFEQAAMRELKEETGYIPGKVTSLGKVYKDAYNNATWHFFLAEDCELHADGTAHEKHEIIEVDLITIEQFLTNAKNGLMTDVEAVFLAYDRLMELKNSNE